MRPYRPHHMTHDPKRFMLMIARRCFIGLLTGCLFIPSVSMADEKPHGTLVTRTSSAELNHPTQEEFKLLQDRVEFLEEHQSSILDEIAQRVNLGGYGALEFESFAKNRTTFEGKLELLVSGQIHDRIRFYNEIDLGVPVGEAKAEQAYVDFLLAQWINLRAGVLLIPFGKFNLDHFDPRRDLTDRPIVATEIVPTTWSDLGVSLFGLIPISADVIGTYEIQVINGLTNNFTPPSEGLRPAEPSLTKDNNGDKAVVGRGTLKFLDQYEIGFSGYDGQSSPTSGNRITGYGFDAEFKPRGTPTLEDFEFKGEFSNFEVQGQTTPSRLYGYYTQVNYHFWPQSLNDTVFGRPFNNPTFTAVFRYDHAHISTTAGIGNLGANRYTFGLNYRPIEDYVIKTEYEINNGNFARNGANGFLASIAWLF